MKKHLILVVDDKPNIREVLSDILKSEGYDVEACRNAEEAMDAVKRSAPDGIIADLKLPDHDGISLIKKVQDVDASIPVLIVTAFGTITSAVEAIKSGAYDYLTKPIDYDRLKILLQRALHQREISNENKMLKKELEDRYSLDNLIGKSAAMKKLFHIINTVAGSNSNVLIYGESGTGKELIAKAIYNLSVRKHNPMVVVDCSSLPEGLLESELFGHEKGSFTGADARKKGRIEFADGGTILLDEIGELSMHLQKKLLRVIQEKKFYRVGGLEPMEIDFRLVSSTNKILKDEVEKGNFRKDLYYRLSVIEIHVPPLRERKEDIPILVDHFIKKIGEKNQVDRKNITGDTMDKLINYDWPGNVRELENCVERLIVFCPDSTITSEYLPESILLSNSCVDDKLPAKDLLDLTEIEKNTILMALNEAEWNKTKAAKMLKINRRALYNRMLKYGIQKK